MSGFDSSSLLAEHLLRLFDDAWRSDPLAAVSLLEEMPLPVGVVEGLLEYNSYDILEVLSSRLDDILSDDPGLSEILASPFYVLFYARGRASVPPSLPPSMWPPEARYAFALNASFPRTERLDVLRCSERPVFQVPSHDDLSAAASALAALLPSRLDLEFLASSADAAVLSALLAYPDTSPGLVVLLWENFADLVDFTRSAYAPMPPPPDVVEMLADLHRSFCSHWSASPLGLRDHVPAPLLSPTSFTLSSGTDSPSSTITISSSSSGSFAAEVVDSDDDRVFSAIDAAAYRRAAAALRHRTLDAEVLGSAELVEAVCHLRPSFSDTELDFLTSHLSVSPLAFSWFWALHVLPKLTPVQIRRVAASAAAQGLYLTTATVRDHLEFSAAVRLFPFTALLNWGFPRVESWLDSHGVDLVAFSALAHKLPHTPAADILLLLRS